MKLAGADTRALEQAARDRGVPLSVLELARDDVRALYARDLVLVRPDQHVAWRGDSLPADPAALMAQVTGVMAAPLAMPGEARYA